MEMLSKGISQRVPKDIRVELELLLAVKKAGSQMQLKKGGWRFGVEALQRKMNKGGSFKRKII